MARIRQWNGFHVRTDGLIIGPSGRVVRGSLQSKGYLQTTTTSGKKVLVHHIVAAAWHGFRNDAGFELDHIDGDKINNHPGNLRVVSRDTHRKLDADRRLVANAHRKKPLEQMSPP